MLVIGITGGIASGKTFLAKEASKILKLRYFSADEAARSILLPSSAVVREILQELPYLELSEGVIDRKLLTKEIFCNPLVKKYIEKIVHPLVYKAAITAILQARRTRQRGVIIEMPLLFEIGFDADCDYVININATERRQKIRLSSRDILNLVKFDDLIACQMTNKKRSTLADFNIENNGSKAFALAEMLKIFRKIRLD